MAKLITNPLNVFYLSGFKSSNAFLIVDGPKRHLFTDSRYWQAARKLRGFTSHLLDAKHPTLIRKLLTDKKSLVFESELPYRSYLQWRKILHGSGCRLKLETAAESIITQREIKKPAEIRCLRQAQKITAKAIAAAQRLLNKNRSEADLAWKIKVILHDLGAEDIAFEPIVAFGSNSAIPHHQSGSRLWRPQDLVLIDCGAKYKGYCGDMTRVFLPTKADSETKGAFAMVNAAQQLALNTLRQSPAGLPLKSVAAAVQKYFSSQGLAENFTHSLGHGVGLEIHEEPRLSLKSRSRLQRKQVFSVEPGLYFPGRFGIRIEDLFFA